MDMKATAAAPEAATSKGFVPNKALGQNFLTDEHVIRAILDASDANGNIVLEVGPGTGALTQGLIEKAERLYAVEKDERLRKLLSERLANGWRSCTRTFWKRILARLCRKVSGTR